MTGPYPERAAERDRWIVARRPPRKAADPHKPSAFLVEDERAENGEVVPVATVCLTNRECPWRCLMCDLWKHTLAETVPLGAIPAQMDYALARLGIIGRTGVPPVPDDPPEPGVIEGKKPSTEIRDRRDACPPLRQIKLYNAGSFFDARAIPPEDYPAIAQRLARFDRAIVECHPALIGEPVRRFRDLLAGRLEVAMGLETAHREVLRRLNKRMTLDQFARAADFLRKHEIALRVFILVKPPFLDEAEALHWAERSIDFAFNCGATVASLIPTRAGNGALEALAERGEFSPARLGTLARALDYGVELRRGRVFADLWDLERFSDCVACFGAQRARLQRTNQTQARQPPVRCHCAALGQFPLSTPLVLPGPGPGGVAKTRN